MTDAQQTTTTQAAVDHMEATFVVQPHLSVSGSFVMEWTVIKDNYSRAEQTEDTTDTC